LLDLPSTGRWAASGCFAEISDRNKILWATD